MNLREIYETLLRRGMPKHPNLATYYGITGIQHKGMDYDPEPEDLADMMVMHALRWLNGGSQRFRHGVACDGEAMPTLMFILEESEHLEPSAK